MKTFFTSFRFACILCICNFTANAQLTFDNGLTAQQLAEMLAGPGVSISNATINCASNGLGSFTGTSNIGINEGIVLTSGSTSVISPNNNQNDAGACNNTPGDNQLGNNGFDACALEFDVVPLCDTIRFRYVFGSDEYPEYVNGGVNDKFAFYISGPGISGQPNIALIPNTNTPVSIDDLNSGSHSQYYITNSGSSIEYDGFTTVLTAWSVVQSCQTYHLKIVIHDEGDCIYDSGVFLEAGSLVCNVNFSASVITQDAIEGCQDGSFEFCRIGSTASPVTVNYTIAGSAVNGTDYTTIPNSIIIPAGQQCASLPIEAIDDQIAEGKDSILLIYQPGPCPVMDTLTIYVSDQGNLDAGPDDTICSGSVTSFGVPNVAGTTYQWSPTTGLSDPNSSNPFTSVNNTGTASQVISYALTATTIGGCVSKDTVLITVYPLPTVNAGQPLTICTSTVQLNGSFGGGATMAYWSGGAGTYAPDSATLNAVYTPTAGEIIAGSVTLTLITDSVYNRCNPASDQVTITLNSPSSVSAGTDQAVCIGNSAILAGSFGGAATGGTWSGGAGAFVPGNTSPTAVYTPTTAEISNGTVTLIYTATTPNSLCGTVADTMILTINQLPTANAGSSQYVCKGAGATLSGSIGGTATSGTWGGGSGTFTPDNTALNAVYTPSAAEYAADSVILTLTTNDPAGPCTASSSNVTIRFHESPDVQFTAGVSAGCPTLCTDFVNTSSITDGTIVSWQWDFGDGSAGSTEQAPSNCYSLSGEYDVKLIATSDNSCVSSLTHLHLVSVYNVPVAEFSTTPNPATLLDPAIQFNNLSSSDVTYWHWDFGDGDTLAPSSASPVHSYTDSVNTYTVTLIVHNANGCYDTIPHEVAVGPAFTFFMPNAFSPNGDGFNDFFFGSGVGIDTYDLWIFDRWGNMLFHTNQLIEGWDGKANNGENTAQIDVYAWKVAIKDVLGTAHSFVGTVSIIR